LKSEYLVDVESKLVLLQAINTSLKKQNQRLARQSSIPRHYGKKHNKGIVMLLLSALPIAFFVPFNIDVHPEQNTPIRTNYVIDNLQGDTVETWKRWNVMNSERIAVNIVNPNTVPQDKIDAIKNAILSTETVQIDDSLLHKGPKGFSTTYYLGWQGAIIEASKNTTQFYIPKDFVILESSRGEGEITVNLLTTKSSDGYTGYTTSTTENGQILKANISIYDVNNLSADQIGTIIRHEFGHALGLGHSTAPEDLMAPTITTMYPYISQCDIDALNSLYDGNTSNEFVCAK